MGIYNPSKLSFNPETKYDNNTAPYKTYRKWGFCKKMLALLLLMSACKTDLKVGTINCLIWA